MQRIRAVFIKFLKFTTVFFLTFWCLSAVRQSLFTAITHPLFILCVVGCTGCLGCHRNVLNKCWVMLRLCFFFFFCLKRSSRLWVPAAGMASCVWAHVSFFPQALPKVKYPDSRWPLNQSFPVTSAANLNPENMLDWVDQGKILFACFFTSFFHHNKGKREKRFPASNQLNNHQWIKLEVTIRGSESTTHNYNL